ncbi:MAG: site-specific integrase [Proteobacteria bacterium]|nr:MAG: site-specific integrase [Pseudomonadota bacterium]
MSFARRPLPTASDRFEASGQSRRTPSDQIPGPPWSTVVHRHLCSTLIRHGGKVEAVRMLAGHSKMAMTARYVHATSSDLQAAIAKLGSAP